jgi:hypothetical protein
MIGDTMVVTKADVQQEAKPIRKEDLPQYQRFSTLQNVSIGIREASRKYGIHPATLSVWAKKNIIQVVAVEKIAHC